MRGTLLVVLILFGFLQIAWSDSCTPLQEDRSVYTSFDPTNGHTLITITMTTSSPPEGYTWQDVVNDTNKYNNAPAPYVLCQVSIGGVILACNTTRRGDWAYTSPLPSLKVSFLNKLKWNNMPRIILNKSPFDASRARNKLVYETLQSVPDMISSYTRWAELYVDNTYYGLYTLIEDLTSDYLKQHMLGKNSWLYKPNNIYWDLSIDTGIVASTDPTFNKVNFEVDMDIRGNKDTTPFVSLENDVFNANLDTLTLFSTRFDVDNFASWLAIVFLIADYDLVFNNWAFYAPQTNTSCADPVRFYWMCWDNDGALSLFYLTTGETDIDFSRAQEGIQYFWEIRPIARFLQVDSLVDVLVSKINSLVTNQFSNAALTNLVGLYKPVIQPILAKSPDIDYLYESQTLAGWSSYIDTMADIPTMQKQRWDSTWVSRPMPINQYQSYGGGDTSSLFFHWDKSFILYHKPLFYQVSISTNNKMSLIVFSQNTTNNWMSVATSLLSPSTTYYYQVLVRNTASPAIYQVANQNTGSNYGVSSFTTPASIPALSTISASVSITNSIQITAFGATYTYATLDNTDPASTASGCTSTPLPIPSGWTLAPNTADTLSNIGSLNKPWGTSSLVLADGTRIAPTTGLYQDGAATYNYFIIENAYQGGALGYSADCTSKPASAKRILLVQVSGTPTLPTPTPPPAPTCCSSTYFPTNTSATSSSPSSTTSSASSGSSASSTGSSGTKGGKTSDALVHAPLLGLLFCACLVSLLC